MFAVGMSLVVDVGFDDVKRLSAMLGWSDGAVLHGAELLLLGVTVLAASKPGEREGAATMLTAGVSVVTGDNVGGLTAGAAKLRKTVRNRESLIMTAVIQALMVIYTTYRLYRLPCSPRA
jgi:predicted anti-sigma-YlaC factor YlaD